MRRVNLIIFFSPPQQVQRRIGTTSRGMDSRMEFPRIARIGRQKVATGVLFYSLFFCCTTMYCFAVSLRGYYVVLLFVEILTLIVYLSLTLSLSFI